MWTGVITNAGAALLEQWDAGGHTLTIDGATVGSGITPTVDMRNAVALKHQEDTAEIIQTEAVEGGTRFKVQVLAAETAYTAHEVGIWGHIDSGASTLIALHQDADTGVSVPDIASSPDFAFALFCIHAISNTEDLQITVDPSVMVTQSTVGDLTQLQTSEKSNIVAAINEVNANADALSADISDAYSSSKTYALGEYCIRDNVLYKCTTAITTAEAWTASHWTATTVAEEIKNRVLFFKNVTVYAFTNGLIVDVFDERITAKHVLTNCVWANSSAIISSPTWTTTAGRLRITGTCTTITSADITLVKSDN